MKNTNMLSKFTVLACYCIYFSKTRSEYAHMFKNVSAVHKTNEDTFNDIAKAAAVAIKMMEPDWEYKKSKDKPISQRSLKSFRKNLRETEHKYKKAENSGSQLNMKKYKKEIEKLREQIERAKIGKTKKNRYSAEDNYK